MASVSISCPSCSATDGVVRNGKSKGISVAPEIIDGMRGGGGRVWGGATPLLNRTHRNH
ncbi:hypothetical protein NL420_015565 [Escherichia coli]|nr:IS1 family transposase [Escherichia coli]WCQ43070.1 hypothetical protein NL420_015565 [Escherichia coli]